MALSFDPKLNSSGSRSSRTSKPKNGKGSSSASAKSGSRTRKTGRGSSTGSMPATGKRSSSRKRSSRTSSPQVTGSSKPIKGKRVSVKDKASRQSVASTGEMGAVESTRGTVSERTRIRRAGEVRAQQREKRQRNQYRRYILRILIAIAAVLAIIFGSIFIYRSDLFHVNNVQVNGVSHLTSQEITSIAAVSDDSTLLRLDAGGIIARLEDNAWVQNAAIHRVFPDTIVIDITERAPGAVAYISDKSTWVISTDGTWLSAATNEDQETAMKIVDISSSMPAPISGTACTDGGVLNALSILKAISDDLRSRIVSISAESSIKTSLNLKDGVTVAFGDSSDVEIKEAAINSLLSQYEGKIAYINVRVPTRPTYRMIEGDTSEEYSYSGGGDSQ